MPPKAKPAKSKAAKKPATPTSEKTVMSSAGCKRFVESIGLKVTKDACEYFVSDVVPYVQNLISQPVAMRTLDKATVKSSDIAAAWEGSGFGSVGGVSAVKMGSKTRYEVTKEGSGFRLQSKGKPYHCGSRSADPLDSYFGSCETDARMSALISIAAKKAASKKRLMQQALKQSAKDSYEVDGETSWTAKSPRRRRRWVPSRRSTPSSTL